ncbi:Pr6Pr family membrane protein [Foetidibacter luteolus]|uniref:Pr6Pr family membrane protein n=1 Tax=Foetidibacter luteolus TaxID=2608880 RepID=UPI00129B703B|nr:Pr6Pr family membrane protein [Foetidibacter luteolus]
MKKGQLIFLVIISLTAWAGLLLQLYIMPKQNGFLRAAEEFFSYFTVLSNLLAALYATLKLFGWWKNPGAAGAILSGAICSYITIVAVVYHTLLSKLWNPAGIFFIADQLLHTVVPVLFVLFWFLYARTGLLQWKHALLFLIFPVCYIIYTIAHGELSGFYPYPFINVGQLGYSAALQNTAGLVVVFLVAGCIVIGLDKSRQNQKQVFAK